MNVEIPRTWPVVTLESHVLAGLTLKTFCCVEWACRVHAHLPWISVSFCAYNARIRN